MSKIKLKSLLEGQSWERKADGSLPTLADAIKTHQANLNEVNVDEFKNDPAVIKAYNQVISAFRKYVENLDDDRTFSVSVQLSQFFNPEPIEIFKK